MNSPDEFDPKWKKRFELLSSYITISGVVGGFGMMWLESYIKPDNTYLPIDYIRRYGRTNLFDTNTYLS